MDETKEDQHKFYQNIEQENFIEMAKSLVCVLDDINIRDILVGKGYSEENIYNFITECQS